MSQQERELIGEIKRLIETLEEDAPDEGALNGPNIAAVIRQLLREKGELEARVKELEAFCAQVNKLGRVLYDLAWKGVP